MITLPCSATNFLPQQHPFQLVDTLLEAGPQTMRASFTVPANHVMVFDGYLSEGGLIEHMAQTAAAATGYISAVENKPVPVGFIGAIKKVQINRCPLVGQTIEAVLETRNQIGQASIVYARVFLQTLCIAEAELTIFLQS